MKLHTLKPAIGSIKRKKRIGRGQGSGKGGTSTKGHKGGQSRSGYKIKRGFEGGQMPLHMRLPKFGFKNPFRIDYSILNLSQLQAFVEKHNTAEFNSDFYLKNRIVSKNDNRIKILGDGELTSAIRIEAHKFSKKAKESIENAGGEVIIIEK